MVFSSTLMVIFVTTVLARHITFIGKLTIPSEPDSQKFSSFSLILTTTSVESAEMD